MKEKQRLIRQNGTRVIVTNGAGGTIETKAIIGKASKQFNNTLSLESQRRGQFLPTVVLDNGDVVSNEVMQEDQLIIAILPEVHRNTLIANVAHMAVCNSYISVTRDLKTATDTGRVETVPTEIFTSKRVYVQTLGGHGLSLTDIGLVPNGKYMVFAPLLNIKPMDKITMEFNGLKLPIKVEHIDYGTYEGLMVLYVCSETRK